MLSKQEERDIERHLDEARMRYIERAAMAEEAQMASRENTGMDKPAAIGNDVQQQSFTTGATRSTSEGKIDYEGHLSPDVLEVFGSYMNRHRIQRNGQLRGSDNWQEGIPIPNYVKSLIRHTFEFWRMWRGHEVPNPDANGAPFTFEDVLSAIMFNVMGIIFEMSRETATGFLQATSVPKKFRQLFLEKAGKSDPDSFQKVCGANKAAILSDVLTDDAYCSPRGLR